VTVSVPFHTFALDPMMISETKDTYKKHCEELAVKSLGVIKTAASAAGVPCEVMHVNAEHPYEGIIDTAKTAGCDLIFMASHGRRGASALLLGSETVKVLTHSKIPVLVSRRATLGQADQRQRALERAREPLGPEIGPARLHPVARRWLRYGRTRWWTPDADLLGCGGGM
jgi:hypothetical protein